MAKGQAGSRRASARPLGHPPRSRGRVRKHLLIDASLLEKAMRVTGRNQSDTVNHALERLTEHASILQGFEEIRGRFPEHPDH